MSSPSAIATDANFRNMIVSKRVALEVVEQIIDWVALATEQRLRDKQKIQYQPLVRCALTSHIWLPRSRCQLVRLLMQKMWDVAQLHALVRTLDYLGPLLAALQRSYLATSMNLSASGSANKLVQSVPLLLGRKRLSHVTKLTIEEWDWPYIYQSGKTLLGGFYMFVSVRSLHLYKCSFPTFHDLRHLLCGFPALHALSLHDIKVETLPPLGTVSFPARPTALPSRLSTVRYENDGLHDKHNFGIVKFAGVGALLKLWLDSTQAGAPATWDIAIQRLWSGHELEPPPEFPALLRRIGHSLTSLSVGYCGSCDFDLSHNPNLQKLNIHYALGLLDMDVISKQLHKTLKSLPDTQEA